MDQYVVILDLEGVLGGLWVKSVCCIVGFFCNLFIGLIVSWLIKATVVGLNVTKIIPLRGVVIGVSPSDTGHICVRGARQVIYCFVISKINHILIANTEFIIILFIYRLALLLANVGQLFLNVIDRAFHRDHILICFLLRALLTNLIPLAYCWFLFFGLHLALLFSFLNESHDCVVALD